MRAGVPKGVFPGAMIGDKYRIERLIASGGQGVVVEATHLRLRQPVAIKFAHVDAHEASENERHERLFREARAAFRLRSEHVARVIDVDMVEGSPFIVMEFLRGTDLKALIAARGPLPCDEAVGLILQACEGLAEAHDLGLIHRDLKPSNLFLAENSSGPPLLKILDFGLAKQLAPAFAGADDPDLTEPLIVLGSPRYMSPEQARDPRQTDGRTDIWALGLVLQELLTGRPVFRARNKADVLALVLLRNPTPVSLLRPDVPPGLERVLLRCLQKLPEHRFPTIRDLAQQLAEFAPPSAAEIVERLRPRTTPGASPAPGNPAAPVRAKQRPPIGEEDHTIVLSAKSGAAAKWRAATRGTGEDVTARSWLTVRAAAAIGVAALAGTVLGFLWDPSAAGLGGVIGERLFRRGAFSVPTPSLSLARAEAAPGAYPLPTPTYDLEPLPAVAVEGAAPASVSAPPAEPAVAVEGARTAVSSVSPLPAARAASSHPLGKRTLRGGRPAVSPIGHAGARHKVAATTSSSRTRTDRRPGAFAGARLSVESAARAKSGVVEADASPTGDDPLDGRK